MPRYQNCASEKLLTSLKRVVRYIKSTIELKLVYKHKSSSTIMSLADVDFGGDTTDYITSGFCLYVYVNTVSWNSKNLTTITISTTEVLSS